MTGEQYKKLRKKLGSQADVARMLGMDISTISRRELGKVVIDKEAEYAIKWLTKGEVK